MESPLPTFLVIGAAKSATTSLHAYLGQHPEILMSSVKEPNFFAFEGGVPKFRGPDDERPGATRIIRRRLRTAKYVDSVTSFERYRELFSRPGRAQAIGESSVSYLYFPQAVDRIRARLPTVKLIALLRNPVDRAFSKFAQFRRDGCEPLEDFDAAVRAEPGRIRDQWSPTWYYVDRGYYFRQLRPYYERFDSTRIRVYLYDDFKRDSLGTLRDMFGFLGVDEAFVPDVSEHHNVSAGATSFGGGVLSYVFDSPNPLKSAFNRLIPNRDVRRRIRNKLLRFRRSGAPRREGMVISDQARRHLQQTFRDDILELEKLIGRDLSAWLA